MSADWIKIGFLALLAWLAWRWRAGSAVPAAQYAFGDIVSAPMIVAANGAQPMPPDPAPTPLATSASGGLQSRITAAARAGGLLGHGSGSVATGRGGTGAYQEP